MIRALMVHGSWSDPIDLAIMLWTQSKYSHCGFLLNQDSVVEVTRAGRRVVPFSEYPWKYDIYEFRGLTERQRIELEKRVIERSQEPMNLYDYGAILTIGLRSLFGFKLNLQSNKAEMCSEFMMKEAVAVGFKSPILPSLTSPQGLVQFRLVGK